MTRYTSFLDNGRTDDEGFAKPYSEFSTGGVWRGLSVSQRGAGANMSVDVSIGSALVMRSTDSFGIPSWIDAVENVAITTADGSNPRHDIIVAYVDPAEYDAANSNNPDAFIIEAVAGTAASSPTDPSDSDIQTAIGVACPFIKLARVEVGTGASSITDANITDLREGARLRIFDFIYDRNDNKLLESAGTASAVNWLKVTNSATGQPIQLEAKGSDTNIGIKLAPKGTGAVIVAPNKVHFNYAATTANSDASNASFADWGNQSVDISVPSWATGAYVTVSITGIILVSAATNTQVQFLIGTDTSTSGWRFGTQTTSEKTNVTMIEKVTLTATGTKTFKIQARRLGGSGAHRLQPSGSEPQSHVSGIVEFY